MSSNLEGSVTEARWIEPASPLDRVITVTTFTDWLAKTKGEIQTSLRDLVPSLKSTTAESKGELPWLKLATFGDLRTDKDSLRSNENMLTITGVEGDYDAGKMPPQDIAAILAMLEIAAIVYTSPSHTEAKPRCRVLCPTSRSLPPGERFKLVARLNGALGGILANESFTASQSYYYGSVRNNPAHVVLVTEGCAIDEVRDITPVYKKGKAEPGATASTKDGDRLAPMPGMTGADTAEFVSDIVTGYRYHESLRDLAGQYAAWDMPAHAIIKTLRGMMESTPKEAQDQRWKDRYSDVPRLAESAVKKYAKAKEEAALPPFTIIQDRDVFGKQPTPTEWIFKDWLPIGCVALNYGDSGTGKTQVAQQIMAAAAVGESLWGLEALQPYKTFGLFCEDPENIIHKRQDAIRQQMGRFEPLTGMAWTCPQGEDNTLVMFDREGRMQTTPAFDRLRQYLLDESIGLCVLDTAARLFAGNENDRRQVTLFVGHCLTKLALEMRGSRGGAILLNAHPSRVGLATDGTSGSTAWKGSCRMQWSFTRPGSNDRGFGDPNARTLTCSKSNYGPSGMTKTLRWTAGAFMHADFGSPEVQAAAADAAFIQLLTRATDENRPVTDSKNASNYAPRVFAEDPASGDVSRQDFEAAMGRLFASKTLACVEYGKNKSRRLVYTGV